MLVTHAAQWFDIPNETERIRLRPLSGPELRAAADVESRRKMATFSDIMKTVSADALDALRSAPAATPDEPDLTDPSLYDAESVARAGIVEWTYDAPLGEALDAATFDWAVREILKLSVRTPGEASRSATVSSTARKSRS